MSAWILIHAHYRAIWRDWCWISSHKKIEYGHSTIISSARHRKHLQIFAWGRWGASKKRSRTPRQVGGCIFCTQFIFPGFFGTRCDSWSLGRTRDFASPMDWQPGWFGGRMWPKTGWCSSRSAGSRALNKTLTQFAIFSWFRFSRGLDEKQFAHGKKQIFPPTLAKPYQSNNYRL